MVSSNLQAFFHIEHHQSPHDARYSLVSKISASSDMYALSRSPKSNDGRSTSFELFKEDISIHITFIKYI